MAGRYAKTTTVSVSASRVELENVLARYGADQFGYMTEEGMTQIAFRIKNLFVRLRIPMPLPGDKEFSVTPTGMIAAESTRKSQYNQALMQRWRALVLVTKAKLEAAEIGISTLEQEFLAHTILPDGQTVAELLIPQIEEAYRTGKQPLLLSETAS